MAIYEKWLGAGLGFAVGGPLGSMVGYAAGDAFNKPKKSYSKTANTSEFETNLLLLASAVIKADGKVAQEEIDFVQKFFTDHFAPEHMEEKMAILRHCLSRHYDVRKACDDIRLSAKPSTRTQIVHFLFDLAIADDKLSGKENDLIFIIAGWLNVNDIEFKKIRAFYTEEKLITYSIFNVPHNAPFDEIKTVYRKLVLEYHPDRNTHLSPAEQKAIADKFRKVQEAFTKIKQERGFE